WLQAVERLPAPGRHQGFPGGGEMAQTHPPSKTAQRLRPRMPASAAESPSSEPTPQLITVNEAAKLLACTPAAVRKWLAMRRLDPVKIGRLTRLKLTDIQRIATEGLPPRRSMFRGP